MSIRSFIMIFEFKINKFSIIFRKNTYFKGQKNNEHIELYKFVNEE